MTIEISENCIEPIFYGWGMLLYSFGKKISRLLQLSEWWIARILQFNKNEIDLTLW